MLTLTFAILLHAGLSAAYHVTLSPAHHEPLSAAHHKPLNPAHHEPLSPAHHKPLSPAHHEPLSPVHHEPLNPAHHEPLSPEYHMPEYHTPEYHTPEYHMPEYHTPEYHTPEYHMPDYHMPLVLPPLLPHHEPLPALPAGPICKRVTRLEVVGQRCSATLSNCTTEDVVVGQNLIGHEEPVCTDHEVVAQAATNGSAHAAPDVDADTVAHVAPVAANSTVKTCIPGAPILEDVMGPVTKCAPVEVCEDMMAEVSETVCGEAAAEEAVEDNLRNIENL